MEIEEYYFSLDFGGMVVRKKAGTLYFVHRRHCVKKLDMCKRVRAHIGICVLYYSSCQHINRSQDCKGKLVPRRQNADCKNNKVTRSSYSSLRESKVVFPRGITNGIPPFPSRLVSGVYESRSTRVRRTRTQLPVRVADLPAFLLKTTKGVHQTILPTGNPPWHILAC